MSRGDGPGWLGAGLAAALAALAGVLITLALGGGDSSEVRTVTVTTHPPPDATLVAKTAVPNLAVDFTSYCDELFGRLWAERIPDAT